MADSDSAVVQRVLSGDREAFGALVERYQTTMYAVAVGKTGNFVAAEDITQSAFVEAYLHLRSLKHPAQFRQWLGAITRNLSNKWLQQRTPMLSLDALAQDEERAPGDPSRAHHAGTVMASLHAPQTPESLYEAAEMRTQVLQAVERLPEHSREVILLHYMEGLTYHEIAEWLGVPDSTVLGRLQTARQQLKEDLMRSVAEVLHDQRPTDAFTRKVMAILPPSPSPRPMRPQVPEGSLGWMGAVVLAAALLGTTLYLTGVIGTTTRPTRGQAPRVWMSTVADSLTVTGNPVDWHAPIPVDSLPRVAHVSAPPETVSAALPSKPALTVSGAPTDSIITITYGLPESAFVEIVVYDRIGEAVAIFVRQTQPAGAHTIRMVTRGLPEGSYVVLLRLDHLLPIRPLRSFLHARPGHVVTFSQEERTLLNQVLTAQAGEVQESSLIADRLLRDYPHFIDRSAVYFYALPSYAAVAESATVSAVIESLVTSLPRSDIYHQIARSLHQAQRHLPLALQYAQQAVHAVDDVVLDREDKRFWYLHTLGEVALAVDHLSEAERAFTQALTLVHQLPPENRWVQAKRDVDILKALGFIQEQQQHYEQASQFYQQGLARAPRRPELWLSLQRAYTLQHGSDIGYEAFKERVARTIPPEDQPAFPDTTAQTVFPAFTLHTLDHEAIASTRFQGKVVVVNFWAYWCSACLPERLMLEQLYQEFRDRSIEVIGIHYFGLGQRDAEERYARTVMQKFPTSFPTVVDTGTLWTQVGIRGVPTSLILDQRGRIRYQEVGYDQDSSYARFKRAIEQLLAEEGKRGSDRPR